MNDRHSKVFSLDLGNSTCRIAFFDEGRLGKDAFVCAKSFVDNPECLLHEVTNSSSPLAYCSVSPIAESSLRKWCSQTGREAVNLKNDCYRGFPISYPRPDEIGQDRIANSFAAHRTSELPAIVIDVGTATTFDVVDRKEGYAGGVIAPGPQGFLDFLHQNTALLPEVRLTDEAPSLPIGKNTTDAMLLGIHLGFGPMVKGILNRLETELLERNGRKAKVILAGGASSHLDLPDSEHRPFLTLEGVAMAYLENFTP